MRGKENEKVRVCCYGWNLWGGRGLLAQKSLLLEKEGLLVFRLHFDVTLHRLKIDHAQAKNRSSQNISVL